MGTADGGVGAEVRVVVEFIILLALIAGLVWWLRRRKARRTTIAGETVPESLGTASAGTGVSHDFGQRTPTAFYVPPAQVREVPSWRERSRYEREIPFAEAHAQGPLFRYAGPLGRTSAAPHDGPYAVIDLETTGLSPRSGDRVIELAIARVDRDGHIEDEYATLINPDGVDTGPVFVHGISNDAVAGAPRFIDIAGELLDRLDGAVVVAHNAPFEEHFLAAEFARAGISLPGPVPALDTLWLAQRTVSTPNHRLGTLCRAAEIPLVDAHAALGDVRAVSALLPHLLGPLPQPLVYGTPTLTGLTPGFVRGTVSPRTRAVQLRKGTDGWMASILDRLPMTAAEADDAQANRYLEALATSLEDGRIIGEEAKLLAKIAGAAGMGSAQVAALNDQFLDNLLAAALEDDILTATEIRTLNRTATALGQPRRFSDLTPTAKTPPSRPTDSSHVMRTAAPTGPITNDASRLDRVQRALVAVEHQQAGASRAAIAAALGVTPETVKQLLRDGKFYLSPQADPTRLTLAQTALEARAAGLRQTDFRTQQALSPGKAQEAWRDAAYLKETQNL